MGAFARFQKRVADSLERGIEKFYRPVLALASAHRYTTICLFFALAMAGLGYHKSGAIGFVDMPKVERYRISAYLSMIDNTPFEETDKQIMTLFEEQRKFIFKLV